MDSKSKFERLFSSPGSKSGWNEEAKIFEKGDLEFANSTILVLVGEVKKLKRQDENVKIVAIDIQKNKTKRGYAKNIRPGYFCLSIHRYSIDNYGQRHSHNDTSNYAYSGDISAK